MFAKKFLEAAKVDFNNDDIISFEEIQRKTNGLLGNEFKGKEPLTTSADKVKEIVKGEDKGKEQNFYSGPSRSNEKEDEKLENTSNKKEETTEQKETPKKDSKINSPELENDAEKSWKRNSEALYNSYKSMRERIISLIDRKLSNTSGDSAIAYDNSNIKAVEDDRRLIANPNGGQLVYGEGFNPVFDIIISEGMYQYYTDKVNDYKHL